MTKLPRIIYNDDSCSLGLVEPPHTPATVERVLDYMEASRIDRLCWCMFGGWGATDWYSRRVENYFELAEKHHSPSLRLNAMYSLYRQGVDYVPLLIDCCRRSGREFYAGIRMNDCHLRSEPNGPMAPAFWRRHQDKRLWGVNSSLSYYNALLDFSYPEVRDCVFQVIDELLSRYDIDGIELDFMRQEWAFNPAEAWAKRRILTDFIAAICARCRRGGTAGRAAGLMVRVPLDPEQWRLGGFDVETWMREGLIDLAVAGTNEVDFRPDLSVIVELGRRYGVPVFGDIELFPVLVRPNETELTREQSLPQYNLGSYETPIAESERMAYGMTDILRAQGVDGLYMFNFPCFRNDCVGAGRCRTPEEMAVFRHLLTHAGGENFSGGAMEYHYRRQVPVYAEPLRPENCFQSLELGFGTTPDEKERVTFDFCCYGAPNPHAFAPEHCGDLKKLLQVKVDGVRIDPGEIAVVHCPGGILRSGYGVGDYERWSFTLPGSRFATERFRMSFFMPDFPGDNTPYIYIHDLSVRRSIGK